MASVKQEILDAFRPNRPIDDPMMFAGRRAQINELCEALHSTGSCILIYGERGLGKSSLALQLSLIGLGNTELLTLHGLRDDWEVSEEDQLVPILIQCTDEVPDATAVKQRIINSLLDLTVTMDPDANVMKIKEKTNVFSLAYRGLGFSQTRAYEPRQLFDGYQALSLEEKIVNLVGHLNEVTGKGVLIILDELDRLDSSGLAPFIKAASHDKLRFLLVGIGHTVSELLADHASVSRILSPVLVPPMPPDDLARICSNATQRLQKAKIKIDIDDAGLALVTDSAAGFPWFVHVLGQQGYMFAAERHSTSCNGSDIQKAITHLSINRFAQQYRDLYQQAVQDSVQRETVLRVMAHWGDPDIPTREVYRDCSQLGVTNPSVYKGHLMSNKYGRILVAPRFQPQRLVRFPDAMFKQYCRLRPSLYNGLDQFIRDYFA